MTDKGKPSTFTGGSMNMYLQHLAGGNSSMDDSIDY